MMRRAWKRVVGGVGALAIVTAGAWAWHTHGGYDRAEKMARFGLWPEARVELSRYLLLHPHDDKAHLAFAEACVKDENLARSDGVEWASRHLRAIPDASRYAAMARSQEGRLELFVLHRPYRAEQQFRHAIQVNPKAVDPYFMIWKLYDLTGRSHLAEAEFWQVFEASKGAERALRLREWYMSQFFPATANPDLDLLIGSADKERDAARTEAQRYIRFRDSEPDGPMGYAALGRWFEQEGDPQFALTVLEKGLQEAPAARRDPFFLATLVNVLIALGELERAERTVGDWLAPREGYEYWLSHGQILHEVKGEPAEAVKSYDRALQIWPGPADWRTLNRKVACLSRLRQTDEVNAVRERIKVVEDLTSDNHLRSLRVALGALDNPDKLKLVSEFYRKLNRPREAQGWDEYVEWLRSHQTPSTTNKP